MRVELQRWSAVVFVRHGGCLGDSWRSRRRRPELEGDPSGAAGATVGGSMLAAKPPGARRMPPKGRERSEDGFRARVFAHERSELGARWLRSKGQHARAG